MRMHMSFDQWKIQIKFKFNHLKNLIILMLNTLYIKCKLNYKQRQCSKNILQDYNMIGKSFKSSVSNS
jgi:hypothetical protein